MSKNIVILSGSPRKNGNTDKLVNAFLEGAKEVQKKATLFRVADMKIHGCLGCEHCFKEKGSCIQKDEMSLILTAMREADTLVLASPIYYFTVSAQLKLAIDRTYALLSEKTPIEQTALLLTCGSGGLPAAEGAVTMYHNMRKFSGWKDAGIIIVPELHNKDDIVGHEELEHAKELGRSI